MHIQDAFKQTLTQQLMTNKIKIVDQSSINQKTNHLLACNDQNYACLKEFNREQNSIYCTLTQPKEIMQHQFNSHSRHLPDLHTYPQRQQPSLLMQAYSTFISFWDSGKRIVSSVLPKSCNRFKRKNNIAPTKHKLASATIELIRTIDAGLDPLYIATKRWITEEQMQERKSKEKSKQQMEEYLNYISQFRKEDGGQQIETKPKSIKRTIIEVQQKSSKMTNLWEIQCRRLTSISMAVIEKSSLNIHQNEIQNTSKQLPTPNQIIDIDGNKSSHPDDHSKIDQNKRDESTPEKVGKKSENVLSSIEQSLEKQLPKESSNTIQMGEDSEQLNTTEKQKQIEEKPKENPFLKKGTPKKINLLDLICKNKTESNLVATTPAQTTNYTNQPIKESTVQPQLSGSQHLNKTYNFSNTSPEASAPFISPFSMINNQNSNKKGLMGSQSANSQSIRMFSPLGFIESSKMYTTTQPGVQYSQNQSLLNSQQRNSPFQSATDNNGAQRSRIVAQMFGSKQKQSFSPQIQLFSDSKSEKTEKKYLSSHANRRHINKSSNLRVS